MELRKDLIKGTKYKPDLQRNMAIRLSQKAFEYKKDSKYEEAIRLLIESNEILMKIYEDGKKGDLYNLDNVDGDKIELRERISSESLRDIGLNYTVMIRIYYDMGQLLFCRDAITQAQKFLIRFDDIRNTKLSRRVK